MHKTEEKTRKLCDLKDRLLDFATTAASVETCNVEGLGQVIDMVKDLCEAEEKLWKACYYHKIVEEMVKEGDGSDRFGYDPWRYSSGRYAPKGHGHRAGYMPEGDPRMWASEPMLDPRDSDGIHRGTYDKYRDARRHYTETGKSADKDEMSHHAKMYMTEAMGTFRDIWKDADPEMKTSMKTQVAALAKELGI